MYSIRFENVHSVDWEGFRGNPQNNTSRDPLKRTREKVTARAILRQGSMREEVEEPTHSTSLHLIDNASF